MWNNSFFKIRISIFFKHHITARCTLTALHLKSWIKDEWLAHWPAATSSWKQRFGETSVVWEQRHARLDLYFLQVLCALCLSLKCCRWWVRRIFQKSNVARRRTSRRPASCARGRDQRLLWVSITARRQLKRLKMFGSTAGRLEMWWVDADHTVLASLQCKRRIIVARCASFVRSYSSSQETTAWKSFQLFFFIFT